MSALSSFKVFIAPFLDRNASQKASKELGNDVKSEVTDATRNISLEIQTSMRKMGGAVSRGQVAGQAIFAMLNRIIAKFDEMKSSIKEASDSLGAMNETAGELDTTVERVARHELTMASAGLSGGQQQAYDQFLMQVQRVMESGTIGSGDRERDITFESDDVLNNALEIRKLLDSGEITLDDLGIAGKQQARLQNTFNALSTEDYLALFNSSRFNGVNGLNQADARNADLQNQHAVAMMLAEAQRIMHVVGSGSQSMVAETLQSERDSYARTSKSLNEDGFSEAMEAQKAMEDMFALLSDTFTNLAVHVLPPLTTALNFVVEAIGNLIERLPSFGEVKDGFNKHVNGIYDVSDLPFDAREITKDSVKNIDTQALTDWLAWYDSLTLAQKTNVHKWESLGGGGLNLNADNMIRQELARRQVEDLTDSTHVQ